jgi:hypothetical protein
MNSKFLSICEKIRKTINEQNGLQDAPIAGSEDPTQPQSPEQQATSMSDEESELPVASNQQIVSVLKAIKGFYGKNKELNTSDVERIKMLSDDESDENIKKIIDTLNSVFNPVETIDTNPKNVPNSDFE